MLEVLIKNMGSSDNNVQQIYMYLVAPLCTNQCLCHRMWYVSGSRPDRAQVGRFPSWGTAVPKGFLAETAYFSSRISLSVMS